MRRIVSCVTAVTCTGAGASTSCSSFFEQADQQQDSGINKQEVFVIHGLEGPR